MTDNEIIKALECCLDISPSTCKNCPLFNVTNSTMVCSKIATKSALDLITRQQAEIERLNKEIQITKDAYTMLQTKIEIIKSEAVKEFADEFERRCIKGGIYPAFVKRQLENVKKEMVGEEK